jgi:peptide deformylase
MILPIRIWPDPVLARVAAPVTAFDAGLRRLAEDMLETMYAAPGRGLAGPQVGVLQRIFVMDTTWKEGTANPRVIVNPVLAAPSEATAEQQEACLSLPGLAAGVIRPVEVDLGWQDLDGGRHRARLTGFDALCAQHETDHLDGVLTIDRIGPQALAELEPALAALRARA